MGNFTLTPPLSAIKTIDWRNLYDEVVKLLESHGKTIDDIDWVECDRLFPDEDSVRQVEIPISNFIEAATKTDFAINVWIIQIAKSLRIYGKERSFLIYVHEYDSSQSLKYVDMDKRRPERMCNVDSFCVDHEDYIMCNPKWSDHT